MSRYPIALDSARVLGGLVVLVAILAGGCATTGQPVEREAEAADGEPLFYPPPPEPARIQFLTSFNDSSRFQKEEPQRTTFQRFLAGEEEWEREDDDVETMGKPYGVAFHDGQLFVVDAFFSVIHVYDLDSRRYSKFGREGRGTLRKPINMCVAADGTRYVADIGRGQIVVFDAENKYVRALGNDEEWAPTGCVVRDNDLFVVDIKDHEIEHRDAATGDVINRFGGPGEEVGQLFKPTNIAMDSAGRLYVSDTINCRIQIFEQDGEVMATFGTVGDALGHFARPKGVAVAPDGLIYVVDAAFDNVQIFDDRGQLYLFFGGPGSNPGNMHLPAGIAINRDSVQYLQRYVADDFIPEYLIVVINQYGFNRVSIYAKGHEPGRAD